MTRFLLFLLFTALLVGVAVGLANNPGALTVDWIGWHLETTASLSLVALLILIGVILLVYRLYGGVRRLPGFFGRGLHERRLKRAGLLLGEGLAAVRGGDLPLARKALREVERLLPDAVGAQLLAAETAAAQGDTEKARDMFNALRENPKFRAVGRRGLMDLAQAAGDEDTVLAMAREGVAAGVTAPWASGTLLPILVRRGQWEEAMMVLGRWSGRAGRSGRADDPQRYVKAALLTAQARHVIALGAPAQAQRLVQQALMLDPGLIEATLIAARLLLAEGKGRKAQQMLEALWRSQPQPDIAELYLSIDDDGDPLKRLQRVETLVASTPEAPQSRIALARAALAARLWGQARQALDPLVRVKPSPEVCRLVAQLEEGENQDLALANQWLLHALSAEPDEAWTCERCGTTHSRWDPVCSSCGALGTIGWRRTTRPALPQPDA
ncbi:heme biosynthesis protein HemY [Pararhodospirillum photometricum]|nr:heme biosynthesis HemY N-terminal domain-containing protein [Pararhodospirillum photometricum]